MWIWVGNQKILPQHAILLLIYQSTKSTISLFYMENVCTKVSTDMFFFFPPPRAPVFSHHFYKG